MPSLTDLYSKLPEWAKQSPAILLLSLTILALWHGDLVMGRTYDAMVTERNEYKTTAFNAVGLVSEQARSRRWRQDGLSWRERQGIEQPKDAQPATLNQTLESSRRVLEASPSPKPN